MHAPVAHVAAAPSTAPPAAPSRAPRRGIADLARDWDLLGPRGFAIVGGAVTALGIILLFVLAANRGWITPAMRVAIGALVSAAAVGVGFWVRRRYGQMQMSLGAVGAGIAGGYATLAAAAARYDLVPDWLALPLAGVIAAVAVVIAIAWSSELLATIGLLGAALAPGLQAIDTGMTWPAAAFAVIVLAATLPLAIPRCWTLLLAGIAAVVTAQVAWLAHAVDLSADAGTTAVAAALVLVVLSAGIWLQLASAQADLDPLASAFALAAVGLALLLVRQLFEAGQDRGIALAAAALSWGVAWAVLRRRQPSLGLVLGISALTLATVASADLLTGTSLAVTWAAESVLLSALAWRLHDARLQATALVYGVLAGVHVFAVDARPDVIFHDPVAGVVTVPSQPWRWQRSPPACWLPPRPFPAPRQACWPGSRSCAPSSRSTATACANGWSSAPPRSARTPLRSRWLRSRSAPGTWRRRSSLPSSVSLSPLPPPGAARSSSWPGRSPGSAVCSPWPCSSTCRSSPSRPSGPSTVRTAAGR